jgi:hypothetical protein
MPVDSFHGRAGDRGNHPLPALRRGDGGHHADRRVCPVLGVSRLPGARGAEAGRLLCVLLLRDNPLPAETGVTREGLDVFHFITQGHRTRTRSRPAGLPSPPSR